MDEKTIKFIVEHESEDTAKFLLGASKYPGVDVPKAVQSIEARKKIRDKVPSWHHQTALEYPFPLALEQCSSEAAAIYKQRFVKRLCPKEGRDESRGGFPTVADFTGGLGIDSYFLSKVSHTLDYYERNAVLCDAARNNFKILSAININVINKVINIADLKTFLLHEFYDLIYLDPARRDTSGGKVYSITRCEPDISVLKDEIFKITDRILVKVSPMADISATLRLLPETSQVHLVSVDNECKEVLLLMEKGFDGEAAIHAVNIEKDGSESDFAFTLAMEQGCRCEYCSGEVLSEGKKEGIYLYEPNKSILKGGAFKLCSERFGLMKIAPNTHLYLGAGQTSGEAAAFPGKRFRVAEILPFGKQVLRTLRLCYPAASVTARNFPLTSDQLRARLGIGESAAVHIFATALPSGKKVLIVSIREEN